MIYFLTVNYYATDLVTKLVNSIISNNDTNLRIIIVNNSIDDESIYALKSENVIILQSETNIGFGNACNLGLTWIYAQNPQAIVWLINPDAYIIKGDLEIKAFFATYPEISVLGTIIYTPAGKIWFAGGKFINGNILTVDVFKNADKDYIICDWVSGCSLLINLSKFSECPHFDTAYFLYYEDFDFCQRYRKHHTIAITNKFSVVHQPSEITNRNIYKKFYYSTYSYLLTIERYTNNLLFRRLMRLLVHAVFLLLVKPQVAFGKIKGILAYLRRSL